MVVMIFATTTSICQSTTTIKDDVLQNGIKWIERGKIDAQLVIVLQQKVDSLNKRIGILEGISLEHKSKDLIQDSIMNTYEAELKNTRLQRDEAMKAAKTIDKKLRRQKRKTAFVGIGTAVVAVGAYFLFIK